MRHIPKQYLLYCLLLLFCIPLSYLYIDRNISTYFMEHADIFKEFGKTASLFGESQWFLGIAIVGALYYKYIKFNSSMMQKFLFLLYVNIFSGAISLTLKMFFARLRPWNLENGHNDYGFLFFQNPDFSLMQNIQYQFSTLLHSSTPYTSFPSGHTTTLFAVFTYMSLLFPRFTYLWLFLALFGAICRILANDHFLSDIFAGIIVGVLSTLFIYSKMGEKLEKNS